MTRLIIPALVALLVSGPAWAGSKEIKDCEILIKAKLKFPGSYQREHVVFAEPWEMRDEGKDGKPGKWEDIDALWTVKIEFTARTNDNSVHRRIGKCDLYYDEGGFFSSKKLNRKLSQAELQYD